MTLNKENYIDLYNREYVVFHANQFDHETRTITLIPKNESELVSLRNYTPRLLYYKPDGRACFYDLSYNEDDSITILLTEQMLSVSGDCLGQLYLTNPSTQEVITSTTFVIKVAKRNDAGEIIESCDDFDALNQMVTRVENVVEKSDTIDEMLTTSEEILEKTQTAYDNAVNAINTAESINSTAEESARLAKESEQNAADSKKEANRHALMSESYFHGGTGVRDGEDEENVLSFYEKIQSIADTNIATEAKAGLVKASDVVHVTTDGTMSIPKLSELENLIKGASSAKVCEDLEDMVTQLNNASLADFTVGTNILIKAVGVPDFWISEVYTENIPYAWTNDEDFINNLHPASSPTENSLQVGYYGISFLETDKVDLTGIAKESYVDQKFTEAQTYSNTNLEAAKGYTDSKVSSAANNQQPTFSQAASRENIISGEKMSVILGKIRKWFSDLKTVAFTGSYSDLTNTPNIPSVGNGTVTIKQAGELKNRFTMNQSGDTTIELADTNTDTWRPVQNNLQSQSTTDSLSANMGYQLANGEARDGTKLPLSGGTITGNIETNQGAKYQTDGNIYMTWAGANMYLSTYLENLQKSGGGKTINSSGQTIFSVVQAASSNMIYFNVDGGRFSDGPSRNGVSPEGWLWILVDGITTRKMAIYFAYGQTDPGMVFWYRCYYNGSWTTDWIWTR